MIRFINYKILLSLQNKLSSFGFMKLPNAIQDLRSLINK